MLSFARIDAPGERVFICDFDDTGDRAIVVQTAADDTKSAASCHVFVLGRSKIRTMMKLHKSYLSVQSVMVDDYINNGTEQILVLCKEKNVSYRLDTPLVTLVKSFILSSVSWECCNNAVDSFPAQTKDVDEIRSRNGHYIMNHLKRQRVSVDTAVVTESLDKQNKLAMMKENRAKQLESIADALVSRLRSAEEAYDQRIEVIRMKKVAITKLKNEICAFSKAHALPTKRPDGHMESPQRNVASFTSEDGSRHTYFVLQPLGVSHIDFNSRTGQLSLSVIVKNISKRQLHDTSLDIVYTANSFDSGPVWSAFKSTRSQVCLPSRSSTCSSMSPSKTFKFIIQAKLSALDIAPSHTHDDIVSHQRNRLCLVASCKMLEGDDNERQNHRAIFVPLYSFDLSAVVCEGRSNDRLSMQKSIQASASRFDELLGACGSFTKKMLNITTDGKTLILRLLLLPKFSYVRSFSMKNLSHEIASSLSHFGWSPVAHNTNKKCSDITFDVNDFYDFATVDLYIGDSTWSREHMFSLSCIVECLKNVLPPTLHVVPSLFANTTLRLLSDAVNAISREDDRSLQLQSPHMRDHDDFVHSQDSAQTKMVQAQCWTDLLLGQILNLFSMT